MVAPGSLAAVLDLIASAPGEWTPIAGGTELMVALPRAAERTQAVSLWGVPSCDLSRQHLRASPSEQEQRFLI